MMRRIIAAAFIVAMLDAATTYVLIASGRGMEVNPFLWFVNNTPESIFFVQLLVVLWLAYLFKMFDALTDMLPTALKARMHKTASSAFAAAIACRIVVVLNNVMGIFIGVTPLADFIFG